MRFSVVITTHNRRDLLDRAIRSALAQPLAVETIVVDDASSDDTQAYVEQLQADLRSRGDHRLIYHRNAGNCGHSASVNIGVDLASGDWIKFLDDDDYLGEQCLAAMARAIAIHPNAAICSCQAAQVDEHERELERSSSTGPGRAFYIPQEDVHYGMLLEVIPFGTPVQVAAKRSAFLQSGGWDSAFDGNCDDIDSWIRIARFGDAVFVNQCLAYRTVWPGSCNQKFAIARRLQTNITMKRKIYQFVHPKYRDYLPDIAEVERYLKLHWGLVALAAGHVWTGLSIVTAAGISKAAVSLLVRAIVFRQSPWLVQQSLVTVRPTDAQMAIEAIEARPALGPAMGVTQRSSRGRRRSRSAAAAATLQTQALHRRIRIRNLWQAMLSGNVWLAVRLSGSIFSGYVRRGLLALYPVTPPISKIPIAASSRDRANITIGILNRINSSTRARPARLKVLRRYLKIRCAIAAFKQGYWLMGICSAVPAIFDLAAWKLWLRTIRAHQLQAQEASIRKIFLAQGEAARSDSIAPSTDHSPPSTSSA